MPLSKMSPLLIILSVLLSLSACKKEKEMEAPLNTNVISEQRMLLVLSAPSIHDNYYKSAFQLIVDFQVSYAKKIMGNDNVIVIVDADTKKYYDTQLPEDVLITAEVYDIWMRDFTTVNPLSPVQFTYTGASMSKKESQEVQNSFVAFANKYGIEMSNTPLLIDGGNIVDNYNGKAITTTRFMTDNKLSKTEAKLQLQKLLGVNQVAIIEPDEDALAHSDGMVSWIDNNTLLINDYSFDKDYKKIVLDELENSFPDVKIVEVPVEFVENKPGEWVGFSSACGVNLNATVTYNSIYVPTFGMKHETKALEIIRNNTTKKVIEVNAENVCAMGGSVRCLTWQVTGENARKLIEAARVD